ncbi:MAG: carbamoyltransferase HypF [Candidatus Thermoplasmatota archaeon]|nr:carbamoyltransferase HypF [Candidatus Thermoplasmatota archaeon]
MKGTVQGVGFRPTVYRVAKEIGLNGYVKNKGGEVEIVIDGDEDLFLKELREGLPPLAEIEEVEKYEEEVYRDDFEIVGSSSGEKESSTIPVDTALCDDCLEEMRNEGDRREGYAFTNCTNCGARYSAIYGLPYDREKTTMAEYGMCEDCLKEYEDPADRRFHAQTISCPRCGPQYTLYDDNEDEIGGIGEFCELMEEGEIAVAKSWGGMHIACRLESIPELREKYSREQKPFAIMVPDLETARKLAHVEREDVFTGPRRPIMIFDKKDNQKELLDLAAPGLPTVGMMLPYTGLHHLIFERLDLEALVMTSANLPGEPMIIRDERAFDLDLDYFLLHDRKIANRIDDSLIRSHGEDMAIIRRSRGYVPEYLEFEDENVMGAGADKSGCIALSKDGRLYPSQYLGDLTSYEAKSFYEDTFEYLTSILGIDDITTIGIDLHPKYQSRDLGLKYAEEFDAEVVEIQHHWAHGASLLLEHDLDQIICIGVDGTGYGEDGNSWGGEVLYCTKKEYERMYHLEDFPLLGGDQAVKNPKRLVYAIEKKLDRESELFEKEKARVFEKMLSDAPVTSSYGRLLDAVSCSLDACCKRTYEGEPAMKLETLLYEGSIEKEYDVPISGSEIKTLGSFIEMRKDRLRKKDKAASYVSSVSKSIAEAALKAAEEKGIESIGISGGVSYNRPIVETIRRYLDERGHDLLVHEKVPNGDMGIPVGQAVIALNR